jgi:cyclase
MLKKRLIFTLLYSDGYFMLSRNFRLQRVGDLGWLQDNYNFSHISFSIDELIVLDVSHGATSSVRFLEVLKQLTKGCFVPIAAGGGVRTIGAARDLLRSGADKVVVNSILYEREGFIRQLASEFGQQCVVASMDIKSASDGSYQVWADGGRRCLEEPASEWIEFVVQDHVGELYLNSMDRDGTGQGYDLGLLDLLPVNMPKPIILAGGVGTVTHLATGLADSRVDAVATANLFNFVGNGLKLARQALIFGGVPLPLWDVEMFEHQLGLEIPARVRND